MNLSIDRELKAEAQAICAKYNYPLTAVVEDMLRIFIRFSKEDGNGQNVG